MSVNQIIIMGHLGGDPELSYTDAGTAKCTFSVATSRQWKDKDSGEKQEETTWHNCLAWGKRGEIIKQYFEKGSMIHIMGEQQHRTYEKDGEKKFWSQINVQNFSFCGRGSGGGGKPDEPDNMNTEEPAGNSSSDDDLPF